MDKAKPLPAYLVQRYHGWKATTYAENSAWYRKLATDGQHPRAMVISCCDSRVHVTSIFGADQGEFFIHRNIANLVPPYQPDCGGVQGCLNMCAGNAPELDEKHSFVGRWMDILRPKYELVKDVTDPSEQLRQLEKHSVMTSLENLMTFPWLAEKVNSGELTLHGMWTDIAEGGLEYYDPAGRKFETV